MAKRSPKQTTLPSAESRTTTLGTLMLPLAAIIVREDFNVRRDFDAKRSADGGDGKRALDSLAESMGRIGQIEAITVRDATADTLAAADGATGLRYYLVSGERRYRAAQILGWTEIRATIVSADHERAINAEENTEREGIKHWERCEAVVAALARGESRKAIAAQWKIHPNTVTTDKGIKEGLIPEIWEAWKGYPEASKIALEIYAKPPEEQKRLWAEALAKREAKAANPVKRKGKRGKAAGPSGPSRAEITGTMAALSAAAEGAEGEAETWLAGALYALRFVLGEGHPKGQATPPSVKAAIKAAEAAAAKAAEEEED